MRRAAKVDANQAEIVKALRQVGASVQSLASTGKGCPDLLVGFRGVNWLLEIKDGQKVKSARKLTDDQVVWHESWRGRVYVVESVEQALEVIKVGGE
jgi:Holliday junction resolvase